MQTSKLKPGTNPDLPSLNKEFSHLLQGGGEELQRPLSSAPVTCSMSCLLPSRYRLPDFCFGDVIILRI